MNLSKTAAAAYMAAALLTVAGCGTGSDTASESTTPSPSGSPRSPSAATTSAPTTSASTPAGPVIDVTVNGDDVTPNGKRIQARLNEPITLVVTADRAGELHVHSTPEQELEYGVGETTLRLTIDKPGIVEVEDHVAEAVVVQLQVS